MYPDGLPDSFGTSDGLCDETAEQLELYSLIDVSSCRAGAFFTDNAEIIRYRQKTFADLEAHPEICDILSRMLPFLRGRRGRLLPLFNIGDRNIHVSHAVSAR